MMTMEIIRTLVYERKAKKLLTDAEILRMEDEIAAAPERWPTISGTGGIRKARAGRGGAGKSGGVRILYYVWIQDETIYFLDIYAKNEKDNLTDVDKKTLKKIVQGLKGGDNA